MTTLIKPHSIHTMETIAQRIRQDKAETTFINATPEQRTEIIQTYITDELARSKQLQTRYITNQDFKHYFRGLVLGLLKNANP
jgi:hypothetical protein